MDTHCGPFLHRQKQAIWRIRCSDLKLNWAHI
jgi:hypothetical protein